MGADALTDLELLAVEIDTLWRRDDRGRLVSEHGVDERPAPYVVIAVARSGLTAAIGGAVPDDLARALTAVANVGDASDPTAPPACLARCEDLLGTAVGPIRLSSGPSYVIERIPAIAAAPPAIVTRSDQTDPAALRAMVPREENWPAHEWTALLDGAIGPWAIAAVGDRVAAICHSARLTGRAAEAGLWTDPDFRGRGLGPAVTAAWASVLAPTGRLLFYSTSAENTSSQRVAARLGLRPIGWLWQLRAEAIL